MPTITFLNKPDPERLGRFLDAVEKWMIDRDYAAHRVKLAAAEQEKAVGEADSVSTSAELIPAPSQPPPASRRKARFRGGAKKKITAVAGDGSGS